MSERDSESNPRVVILKPLDVLFVEVAESDLQHHATSTAHRREAVHSPIRDPDQLIVHGHPGPLPHSHLNRPLKDLPHLTPMLMPLKRQALPRLYGHGLDRHC